MTGHARFAPSDAHIWGNCSGAIRARAGRPDVETEAQRVGTAAHWVIEQDISGAPVKLGDTAPNGVVIDDEMLTGAQVLLDDFQSVRGRYPDALVLCEQRVHMPEIHADNWGTPDLALLTPDRRWLFLWDYKHGHRDVSPRNNLQMIDYLLGLANEWGLTDTEVTAVVRIVQPFSYSSSGPVKEWVVRLSDLRAHWNHLHAMAAEADAGGTLSTGIWCRDCSARVDCAAVRRATYNLIDLCREPYELDKMDGHSLGVERRVIADGLKVAKSRLEAIEDELQQRIRDGATDTGLKLQQGYGREQFDAPPEVVIALARQFGVDASKPGTKTPKQVLKDAPAAVRPALESVLKQHITRPPGAIKLVPVDESRTADAFKKEQ